MNDGGDLRRFCKTGALFFLPVILFALITIFGARYTGEITSLHNVIERQMQPGQQYLFGRLVVRRETMKYKYASLLRHDPTLLVLGSSRVLQFRDEMFDLDHHFYNAGSLVSSVGDLGDFLEMLPYDKQPKTILLGLDPWWFDQSNSDQRELQNELKSREEFMNWQPYLYTGRHFVSSFLHNGFGYAAIIASGLDPLTGSVAIGLDALETGRGFRYDGSRQYANHIRTMREELVYVDRESPPIVDRIITGHQPFSLASLYDPARTELLDTFLSAAKARGIEVIGISPPFSSEVTDALHSSYYGNVFESFTRDAFSIFKENGYSFYDYSDLSTLQLEDVYMFDGFHIAETGVAILLVDLVDRHCTQATSAFCEGVTDTLEKQLAHELTTPIEVYWDLEVSEKDLTATDL